MGKILKTKIVCLRFTQEDYNTIDKEAVNKNMSLSAYVRSLVVMYIKSKNVENEE